MAGLLFPVTLAAFLFGLTTGKNLPGLADRFPSTVQYAQAGTAVPFRSALDRAFKPYVLAFLVNAFLVGLPYVLGYHYIENRKAERAAYVNSPEAKAKRETFRREMETRLEDRAVRAAAVQHLIVMDMLAGMEKRHLADHGRYTGDLTALVAEYAGDPRHPAHDLLRASLAEGSIRAEQTDMSVTLWVQTASGEWTSRVLRH